MVCYQKLLDVVEKKIQELGENTTHRLQIWLKRLKWRPNQESEAQTLRKQLALLEMENMENMETICKYFNKIQVLSN
ncbi:hypothetical protein CR513_03514, partial [Mucuna pruriens]